MPIVILSSWEDATPAYLAGANAFVRKGMDIDQYFRKENSLKVFKSNIFRKEDLETNGGEELTHTRSFLKIQDGCDSFCSFCIISFQVNIIIF